ncbi:Maph45 [Matsumuraeses phaseoli granulovirus]|uniref:Maph45 n=1 Tax=Matsumuraeses phaseoli granulovirus TaxID=2760664 RepID=A0AAE7MLB8_9BBAC|nr:Maph45 [Matsumuraeses phaseoli granulovirus]QOD40008.1 Maph45 [Matsumuraeses phaseoli granulovirus]
MILIVIVAFFICIIFLYIIKLNRGQEVARILYEHKFIPQPLGKYVYKIKL